MELIIELKKYFDHWLLESMLSVNIMCLINNRLLAFKQLAVFPCLFHC